MILKTILTLTCVLISVKTYCQDTVIAGDKIALKANARVEVGNNGFLFIYQLANGANAQQDVEEFSLRSLASVGVTNITAATDWEGNFYNQKEVFVRWMAIPKNDAEGYINALKPGATLTGNSFASHALPGIVTYYAEGNHPLPHFPEGMATDSIPGYTDLTPYGPGVVGRTIGPVITPNPFKALEFLDTLLGYSTQSRLLGWIKDQVAADKYLGYLSSARTRLVQSDSIGARTVLQQVLRDVDIDSTANLSSEAYALLKFNTEYLANTLPQPHTAPFFVVKLVNSTGTNVTGGSLQYYEGSWKNAVNNNDGTFSITTSLKTLSLRMTYEYGSQTKSNVTVGPDVVIFQTVNAQVKLQNSQSTLMDTGSVQYYAGAWRSFGSTMSGIAFKELLPGNYSFRMAYAGASNDKQQDIGSNPVVVFQTVNASAQLKNSLGALMDQGTVQYYAGTWRNFGVTTNGTVTKELLPNNYSFRMTYAYGSKDLQQNIGTNPVVVFQTANATVQLKNSQGALVDQGTVQYYAGAWRTFGTTSDGSVSKELLPVSYSFRMTNEGVSNDKTQDISLNSTVIFGTVLCTVSVKSSQSQPVNNAMISYYSGAWRLIGPTVNGQVTKELLPANLTFRMVLGAVSQDKVQNIGTNGLVEFVTQ